MIHIKGFKVKRFYIAYLEKNINNLSIVDSMLINMIIAQLYIDTDELENAKKYLKMNIDIDGYVEHEFAKKSIEKLAKL